MIIGHYATALYPYSRFKNIPLWIFLLSANVTDFFWLILALIGWETPNPSSMWTATFQNMRVEMTYSHDAFPTLLLAILTGLIVYFFYRQIFPALSCAGLVVLHFLADLLVGFEHHLLGENSPSLGLNLYANAPHLALILEAIFSIFFVFLYFRSEQQQGRKISLREKVVVYTIFVVGTLVWLPTATIPLGKIFAG